MPSHFKIYQRLDSNSANATDPHNNTQNATLARLKDRMAKRNETELNVTALTLESSSTAQAAPIINIHDHAVSSDVVYTDTMTGPESDVYLLSANCNHELQAFIDSLAAYNVTRGGNCTVPSDTVFSNTACDDGRNSTLHGNLSVQACERPVIDTRAMFFILANATELCREPGPAIERSNNGVIYASVALGLITATICLLTLLAHSRKNKTSSIAAYQVVNANAEDEEKEPLRYTFK